MKGNINNPDPFEPEFASTGQLPQPIQKASISNERIRHTTVTSVATITLFAISVLGLIMGIKMGGAGNTSDVGFEAITSTATVISSSLSTSTPLATDTVKLSPTNTIAPLPPIVPVIHPTFTPKPFPTHTPIPSPTKTPMPTSTSTPSPKPTNTPLSTPTNTPLPTSTNTPLPPTNTPLPTPTNTPVSPTLNVTILACPGPLAYPPFQVTNVGGGELDWSGTISNNSTGTLNPSSGALSHGSSQTIGYSNVSVPVTGGPPPLHIVLQSNGGNTNFTVNACA